MTQRVDARYLPARLLLRPLLAIGAALLLAMPAAQAQIAPAPAAPAAIQPAPGTLNLSSAGQSYDLAPHLYVTDDPGKTLTWPEMVNRFRENLKGHKLDGTALHRAQPGGAYWIEATLHNRTETTLWVLRLGDVGEGRSGVIRRLSILQADNARALADLVRPSHAIPIAIPRGETVTLLMRLETDTGLPLVLPLSLVPAQQIADSLSPTTLLLISLCGLGALFFFVAGLLRLQRGAVPIAGFYTFWAVFVFWQSHFSLHNFALGGEILPALLTVALICGVIGAQGFWQKDGGQSLLARIGLSLVTAVSLICIVLYTLLPMGNPLFNTAFMMAPLALLCGTLLALSLRALGAHGATTGDRTMATAWIVFVGGFAGWLVYLYQIAPLGGMGTNALWSALCIQIVIGILASLHQIRSSRLEEIQVYERNRRDEAQQARIRQSKEAADQARLLRVLEREREVMNELRERENIRTEEMRIAKEAADEANRAKSAFLAVVSHEIRTPMTGVMGMVRLLLDSNLTKDQRENVQTMQKSGDAMLALLNDILDFEKIEVGRVELESIPVDLPRLIQSIVTLMSGHATQKKITLAASLDPNLPKQVMGDPTRLRQVLLNLTGNAIKFTSQGSVTLRVEAGEMMNEKNRLITFSVVDTGIGISEEARKNLFSPFAQADSSITRKFGGTGLGLAISKGLINAMGSNIEVTSREGHGSRFFFTLPMKVVEVAPLTQPTVIESAAPYKPVLNPCSVLLVEDNDVNRKVISGFLDKEPVTLSEAADADAAFAQLNANTFDLILMDIELPGMRGDEITRTLREQGLKTPVIGLTGNVSNEDTKRYYAAGMDGVVGKPVDPDRLKSTMQRILAERESGGAAAAETAVAGPVIEDTAAPAHAPFDTAILQTLKDNLPAEQLDELIGSAVDKAGEIIGELMEARAAGDIARLTAKGHELKGMAGNFGMMEMSHIAGEIERAGRSGAMDEAALALIDTLPQAKARADKALAEWLA